MGRTTIHPAILELVIADLPDEFATRDVSEDDRMLRVHPIEARHRQYHGFVGGALSDHRRVLRIREVAKNTPRGSLWRKT